ncbi:F-box protein At2g26160-like [Silene latifolia]|uniref:F-box protein At2g26160-like n=1 Tax=Silene latifolia TaxID=37657 RepID=UPI003D77CCEB
MALSCTRHGCRGGTYDWAELPCDIIVSIFEHLDEYLADLRRAASVCVAWRRAGSFLNSKEPSIIKLPFICTCPAYNDITNCVCRLRKYSNSELRPNLFYFLISPALNRTQTRVWLIRAEEIGTNKWLLRPPSSSDHQIIPPGLEYNFNLLDVDKILGVAKLHILHYPNPNSVVRKVIPMSDLGKQFLVLFDEKGKLAIISSVKSQWSYIDTANYEFDDIINLGGELYAIDTIGRLVMINPTTLDLVEVASPPKEIEYDVKVMYPVCSDGFLYLVYRGFVGADSTRLIRRQSWDSWIKNRRPGLPQWIDFSRPEIIGEPKDVGVLMFDKQNRVWVRVENLGNKLFFVTKYATFSVTAKELGWSEGSFICFMCKDFHNVPDFGKAPIIYKVEGNVCRKQENEHSDIKVDFGRPPNWIRPMLYSSKTRKSRKSKGKKGRKGK